MTKSQNHHHSGEILGDIELPTQWTVFVRPEPATDALQAPDEEDFNIMAPGPLQRLRKAAQEDETAWLPDDFATAIPATMRIEGHTVEPCTVEPVQGQADLRPLLGEPPFGTGMHRPADNRACGRTAWIFLPFKSEPDTTITLGFGADLWLIAWLNGEKICDLRKTPLPFPPSIRDVRVDAKCRADANLLVIKFVSGKGSSTLAIGGPRDLRERLFDNSILDDPILAGDPSWKTLRLAADPALKEPVEIGDRLELFVDDLLLESCSPQLTRRLHHPNPQEIVFKFDQPWEGNFNACFQPVSIFHDGDRILMYYKAANYLGPEDPSAFDYQKRDRSRPEATCLAVSSDGIHFERLTVGEHEFGGSIDNNMVWSGRQYLTPFLDTKPGVKEEERFKGISGHPSGGLGAYASPDGIHWNLLHPQPVITKGAFDSQNLAFWDEVRGCYREYHRGSEPRGPRRGVRGIMTCQSDDFVHWSDPVCIDYDDDLPLHMYTNCIRPYARAPHLLIGTPARLVGSRKKVPEHVDSGVSDAMLIASRDGHFFTRWLEAFIRPNVEPENWTDRNCFPAWGMIQTAPHELSVYWCEHNGFPSLRLRRGILRTDGMVSLSAGFEVGECLTRPFTFRGDSLKVNYATSAAGAIRFELCHPDGSAIAGLSMEQSEVLFGNEIEHTVQWQRSCNLADWAGKPVRLRIRMQDADLYSLRFG